MALNCETALLTEHCGVPLSSRMSIANFSEKIMRVLRIMHFVIHSYIYCYLAMRLCLFSVSTACVYLENACLER